VRGTGQPWVVGVVVRRFVPRSRTRRCPRVGPSESNVQMQLPSKNINHQEPRTPSTTRRLVMLMIPSALQFGVGQLQHGACGTLWLCWMCWMCWMCRQVVLHIPFWRIPKHSTSGKMRRRNHPIKSVYIQLETGSWQPKCSISILNISWSLGIAPRWKSERQAFTYNGYWFIQQIFWLFVSLFIIMPKRIS